MRMTRKNADRQPWVAQLLERKPAKIAKVALANKTALIAWAVMSRKEVYAAPVALPFSDARYDLAVKARAIAAERWQSLHIKPRNTSQSAMPNPKLVNLIKSARNAQRLIAQHRDASVNELARMQHCRPAKFARLVRLNYLAPDIVTAILDGTQPPALRRHDLLMSNVPTDWAVQRKLYGFPSPERAIEPRNLYGGGMWPSCRSDETPKTES
jgi:site-specific DNA recombinase